MLPALRSDPLQTSHIRTQRLRDDDASVGLLIVFQNRDHRAAHSQSGAALLDLDAQARAVAAQIAQRWVV